MLGVVTPCLERKRRHGSTISDGQEKRQTISRRSWSASWHYHSAANQMWSSGARTVTKSSTHSKSDFQVLSSVSTFGISFWMYVSAQKTHVIEIGSMVRFLIMLPFCGMSLQTPNKSLQPTGIRAGARLPVAEFRR